jgi:Protein of unknown function (DUF559)
MAAVLVCGMGAALSHRSAAALWGIGTEKAGRIDVSVARHCSLKPRRLTIPGSRQRVRVHAHSRHALAREDLTRRLRVPVTTPVQTLIDLAMELPKNRLERAVNEADKHDLVDPEALRDALKERSGERGVRALRRVLDRHTFRLSDSDLELLFRPIAAAVGLPPPLTKQIVNGHEVDFHFPELGLVVETDGWRYHRTPAAQTRDVLRDQAHTASGLTPLRFSHWQVKHEPTHVRSVLARTTANLRRHRPAPSPS